MVLEPEGNEYTLFLYKNTFYKTIEAEICKILRVFWEWTHGWDFEKDIILCVENPVRKIQLYVFNLSDKIIPFSIRQN